jgi:hypothetical protein
MRIICEQSIKPSRELNYMQRISSDVLNGLGQVTLSTWILPIILSVKHLRSPVTREMTLERLIKGGWQKPFTNLTEKVAE